MAAKLFVVPASHPSTAAARALEIKGIEFQTVYLVPVFHKLHQKIRFRDGSTVPGVIFDDGRKVLSSKAIVREVERTHPEPALFPADPEKRKRVEEAESWGDEVLQPIGRRVVWTALLRNPRAQQSYAEGVKLMPPTPAPMARLAAKPVSIMERRINKATDSGVQADLKALPRHVERIEGWIRDGVLTTDGTPNAADLQIASSLRLLMTIEDLEPYFNDTVTEYALRVVPEYPGKTPKGALPAEWISAASTSAA